MKYRLTVAAEQDIRDITNRIRTVQRSPQNALLVARRLRKLFRQLVELPNLGHAREELGDEAARVVAVTGVPVIYDPILKPLTILPVVDAVRSLKQIAPR